MRVGVLALQGCVDPHIEILRPLGVECVKVRFPEDLAGVERLILPGGESTTNLILLKRNNLFDELISFARQKPVWGICAGAVLAAKVVEPEPQDSLGIINARAVRNYYGCQLYSFNARIKLEQPDTAVDVQFIRAPVLEPLADSVKVHATYEKQCVFLQEGRVMATTFHVELGDSASLHKYFLEL